MSKFQTDAQILKVDTGLGLIFGFSIICKVDGEEFWDSDNEHFEERAMLEASTDFAKSSRVACVMHSRDVNGNPVQDGGVVHTFPLTTEIAKALDIVTKHTGLLVALAPDNPETLEKASNGEFTGFSIGGVILEAEDE